jgi:CDP-diglyceride synthetase
MFDLKNVFRVFVFLLLFIIGVLGIFLLPIGAALAIADALPQISPWNTLLGIIGLFATFFLVASLEIWLFRHTEGGR